jgi:hypothetical protein
VENVNHVAAAVIDPQPMKQLYAVVDCCSHSALEVRVVQLQHRPNWKEHRALKKILDGFNEL